MRSTPQTAAPSTASLPCGPLPDRLLLFAAGLRWARGRCVIRPEHTHARGTRSRRAALIVSRTDQTDIVEAAAGRSRSQIATTFRDRAAVQAAAARSDGRSIYRCDPAGRDRSDGSGLHRLRGYRRAGISPPRARSTDARPALRHAVSVGPRALRIRGLVFGDVVVKLLQSMESFKRPVRRHSGKPNCLRTVALSIVDFLIGAGSRFP